ncbi:MAG: winged helix-turn-helix transcriptional regulator, partial [Pseudomonadota bacterium]
VNITARAWALDILAALHRGVPGRQAKLMAATGAGRSAFAESLRHLQDLDLLTRNPGHGHPLRPEYMLTEQGRALAAAAGAIRAAPNADHALLRRAWTVPVLAVTSVHRTFTDIRRQLPQVTDRALSQSLKQLQAVNWLARDVAHDIRPPRARYQAVGPGRVISQAAQLIRP